MPADTNTPHSTVSTTDARILDAALTLFAEIGIKRTTIDDIARSAGVNRATLFRRLGSKDGIVRAALLREATRVLDAIGEQVDPLRDPAERVVAGFATTVLALRTNPILVKALAVDPEETLPALTVAAGGILDLATTYVAERIIVARPGRTGVDELAGMIVRLAHSLILTPDATPRVRTEQELRDFASRQLIPLILDK